MQKAIVQLALDSFSVEMDIDSFIEKIYLLKKIEIGEKQIESGETLTHDEAKQRLK